MNCNLVIANDYGGLLDNIKKLSTKSLLLLEKGAACQFDLSLVELALSFPGMEKKTEKLNLLSYPEHMDLYSFHPIRNLKIKAFSLKILKKQKNIVLP